MVRSDSSKTTHNFWCHYGFAVLVYPIPIDRLKTVRHWNSVYLFIVPRPFPAKVCSKLFRLLPYTIKRSVGKVYWSTQMSTTQVGVGQKNGRGTAAISVGVPHNSRPKEISPAESLIGRELKTLHSALLPILPNHPRVKKKVCAEVQGFQSENSNEVTQPGLRESPCAK